MTDYETGFRRDHYKYPEGIWPNGNLLVGLDIARYMKNVKMADLVIWSEKYGFPMVRRPSDGRHISSMQSIDDWIFWTAARRTEPITTNKQSLRKMERLQKHLDRQKALHSAMHALGDEYRAEKQAKAKKD